MVRTITSLASPSSKEKIKTKLTMKKQYTTPLFEKQSIETASIICVSVKFGEGSTSVMHSNKLDDFDEEWDEE